MEYIIHASARSLLVYKKQTKIIKKSMNPLEIQVFMVKNVGSVLDTGDRTHLKERLIGRHMLSCCIEKISNLSELRGSDSVVMTAKVRFYGDRLLG